MATDDISTRTRRSVLDGQVEFYARWRRSLVACWPGMDIGVLRQAEQDCENDIETYEAMLLSGEDPSATKSSWSKPRHRIALPPELEVPLPDWDSYDTVEVEAPRSAAPCAAPDPEERDRYDEFQRKVNRV